MKKRMCESYQNWELFCIFATKVQPLQFTETDDGIEVELIEIDSTHYGNKK